MLINPGDGGFSVDEALLEYIFFTLPTGKTILEFGAGMSTVIFRANGYNVISVEHNKDFVGLVEGVTYIHAPIELYDDKYDLPPSIKKRVQSEQTGWYNRQVLGEKLNNISYDLILIDGPPRNYGRSGFFSNKGLLPDLTVPILFDDMHRIDELVLARSMAAFLKRDLLIKNNGYESVNGKTQQRKPFGVLL